MIKYVIKNMQIDFFNDCAIDRWNIKKMAQQPGMERCLKVLKDYEFF
jgi:hypothetical protein